MRVALLSDCYLPRLGGIEVQVHDLAQALRAAEHEATVITATPDSAGGGTKDPNVQRLALPFVLPAGLVANPLAFGPLRHELRTGGYDVAHVHMGVVSPFAMDAVQASLSLGIPTVVTWHCMLAYAVPLIRRLGYVRRWADRGAVLTAVSDVAAQPLRDLADGPVSVLPNGIDPARWAPEPRVRHDDGAVRFVTAMRLARRKRPHDLVELAARARATSGADLRLEILGDGPWRGHLERWISAHEAQSWVTLPGRVNRATLHERYLAADAYIAPAELEAFGIAALEARASGLPVIGPRQSGITEFVEHGISGLLTDGDDGLVEGLVHLAKDTAVREGIRAHNVSMPIRQQWDSVVDTSVGAYAQAIRAGSLGR
ncbi:glycosyltransferase [Demetria terragena]|uniref:glycosyltransferase n=1 Tax=Demetria terragena TaxID=63959 RepID=UPI0003802233|nr:glycosyltransferase [Demetria terragena]